jgi:hypothetical protein
LLHLLTSNQALVRFVRVVVEGVIFSHLLI